MTSVIVVSKRNGVLLPCRPHQQADGFVWFCGACVTSPICRVSFGVMNGLWRCQCGAEIEVCVDGEMVDLAALAVPSPDDIRRAMDGSLASSAGTWNNLKRAPQPSPPDNVVPFPKKTDNEFLQGCGIALDEDGDEPA